MKKIINGKMYNTETACLMGERSNCYGPSDFRCCSEQLYQKRTKEFFMYGCGGAMTRYAEYVEGCGSTYGEKIIPITEDEAKEWVEKYLTVDEYIKIFGECEE